MKAKRKSSVSKKQKQNYASAQRHGLKPFGHFKKSLIGSLDRIPRDQRESVLDTIYALAARRVRIEDEKETEQAVVSRLRPDRKKLVQVRQRLQNAVEELSAADTIFPRQPFPWSDFSETIDELELRVKNIEAFEILCANLIHPKVRTKKENETATFSGEKYPNFSLRLTKKDSEIDFGFISALEQCLPHLPSRGAKIDAERSRIISKVFEVAFGESGYTPKRISKIRERLKKKPLASNPILTRQKP